MLRGWTFSIWVLLALMLVGNQSLSKDKSKLTKTISKKFAATRGSKLEIQHKYGDVIVNTWNQDSIGFDITITAYGKNDAAAEQLIDRTIIQFNPLINGLEVYTEVNKSDGWFKDFWNELNGYSQTIISKDQLTIEYDVYLPAHLTLELNNKFGDVYVADRNGNTRLEVTNGNLKADDISGDIYLDLKFGNGDISSVQSGDISLKSAELNLDTAEELVIQSSSSSINLGAVGKLRLTSRTDKISINDINNLSGGSSFSKIRLRNLNGNLDLDTNYGALTLENVYSKFSEVSVRGKSTDIEMIFDHMAYFNARIVAKDGKFELPEDHELKQVYTDGTEKFIRSTGNLGNMKSLPGEVSIDAQGGKVRISFAPFDARTHKEKQ